MKLSIVSDLHCNIDGLDQALETMGPIDALLCLGDSIYEYGFSNAVTAGCASSTRSPSWAIIEEIFLGAAGVRARCGDRPAIAQLARRAATEGGTR